MSAAQDLQAEAEHHSTQRERLRAILETGIVYTNVELQRLVGGQRFGGRLFELRSGKHGPALDVRVAPVNGRRSVFTYQCVGVLISPDDLGKKEALRKRLAVNRSRQTRLREEEASILEQLTGGGG